MPSSYTLTPEKKLVWRSIVEAAPMYPRGTFAYMQLEYGVILSEIVMRVTGKTLPEFLDVEIATPLHLPALQYGLANRDINTLAYSFWL
ncbi:MAG: serine hydrolase, partial [Legionellales bacterium]|nr:serine hydrolase [Legionellales bacterium]